MQTKVLNLEEDNEVTFISLHANSRARELNYLHIPPILPRPLQQHPALSSGIRRCLKLLGKEKASMILESKVLIGIR